MIKISNQILINSVQVLSRLAATELPIKLSYILAKNINKIEKELEIYNAERSKLIDKYGIKDKDGKVKVKDGQIDIQKKFITKWNDEHKELLCMENEIDLTLIEIDNLVDGCCDLTPNEINAISYLIKE